MLMPIGREKGFTLIEAMITAAIIAILAAIAYPSYQNYVRQARRADAHAALLRIQLEQEKWRVNRPTYTSNLADLNLTATSPDGYYTLAIVSASGTDFTATATALGSQASDTACTIIILIVPPPSAVDNGRTPAECWKK